ncbi:MAG: hypothetical protein ACRERV_16315, partial [Methylococcales bacterium]
MFDLVLCFHSAVMNGFLIFGQYFFSGVGQGYVAFWPTGPVRTVSLLGADVCGPGDGGKVR